MSCSTSTDFVIKRHDTLPKIQVTISSYVNGVLTPVNLTGATAKFIMVEDTAAKTVVVNAAAVVTGATTGKLEYVWLSADTSVSGNYLGEFEIIFPSGKRTVPADNSLRIIIQDDFDNV